MPETSTLRVNVRETLRFFDEKPDWSAQQATAVVAVLGEDLAAAALQHCLEANDASKVTIRTETVGTGGLKGPRLDRWIEVDLSSGQRFLFQTEIKNWSAHAIGGRTLALDAPAGSVEKYKQCHWANGWDAESWTFKRSDVAKVLVPMQPSFDTDDRTILPLVIYWTSTGPEYREDRVPGGHLFSIDRPTCNFPFRPPATWPREMGFPELWVFSVSSYLRSVPQEEEEIELHMPNAANRLRTLNLLAPH